MSFSAPECAGHRVQLSSGNTFTALTALLLDGVSGGLAGAIGLALADIMAGDPGYAVTTFILKFIIGLVCGGVAHRIITCAASRPAASSSTSARSRPLRSAACWSMSLPTLHRLLPQPLYLRPACRVRQRCDQDLQRRHPCQLAAVHRLRRAALSGTAPRAGKGTSAAEG